MSPMPGKIPLLVLHKLSSAHQAQVGAVYDMSYAPTPAERAAAVAAHGARFRAVLTIGTIGLTAKEIAAMPQLELICAMGVGYECIDVDAARARGIALANGAGTNDDCVADHAMGLLISVIRDIRKLDRLCREGAWREDISQPPGVSGKRLGIFGLGLIGRKIALRAQAFNMEVGYCNRGPREGVAYRYFENILSLAEWADVLLLAAPGGPQTRHAVDAAVLDALGPDGWVVNIGRGTLVDTEALAAALRAGRIAGAGLDVYEGEPQRPELLIGLDNVLLTPHVAGWSPEATQASVDRFMANAQEYFEGRGVVSPI